MFVDLVTIMTCVPGLVKPTVNSPCRKRRRSRPRAGRPVAPLAGCLDERMATEQERARVDNASREIEARPE
jgi:hypothetical protein